MSLLDVRDGIAGVFALIAPATVDGSSSTYRRRVKLRLRCDTAR